MNISRVIADNMNIVHGDYSFSHEQFFTINYDVTIIYDDEYAVKCDDTKLLGEIKKYLKNWIYLPTSFD